ncbi:MAG: hypothetical protein JSR66_02190 [Proteobacteria bacterium]|nr:hypothetical protein [Pseudomonadota bacterium]
MNAAYPFQPVPLSGGDAIVQALIAHGVDTVFGLPGAQTYGLFDALYRVRDRIRVVETRHEQAAAYMAFGYARSTGRAAVYTVVPGPGVLNTTAALCTAFGCNMPVLCLTGQVPSAYIGKGRGHLHELPDQLGTLRTLVKWAERINRPQEAGGLVAEAFRQMMSGRQGPAALETPWDVFGAVEEVSPVSSPVVEVAPELDYDQLAPVADVIAQSRRPMLMVGGGAVDASAQVLELARLLRAPVVAFRSGRGIVPEDSEWSASIVGAYKLWPETDLLIGIGSRLEVPFMRWPYRPPGLRCVRLDIDPRERTRLNVDADLLADARVGLDALLKVLKARRLAAEDRLPAIAAARGEAEKDIGAIQPHAAYLAAIRRALPRDGLFVEELCQAGFTSYFAFPVYAPRTYLSSGYQGTLGFGFMTALGAKVAHPDKAVVSVTGDGGFLFGASELATAVRHRIGVVTVVFDNSAYGNVRRDQQNQYGGRLLGAELKSPDFVRLSDSFGALALRAGSPDELEKALRIALSQDLPAVIHVPVDPDDEVSPWPLIHPRPPVG